MMGAGSLPPQQRPCRNVGPVVPDLSFQGGQKSELLCGGLLTLKHGLQFLFENVMWGEANASVGQIRAASLTTSETEEPNDFPKYSRDQFFSSLLLPTMPNLETFYY